MRVHGYCERCHKVKRVTVRYPSHGRVQIGVCDECANPEPEWACPVCKQVNRNRTGYCTRCRAHTQDRRHR